MARSSSGLEKEDVSLHAVFFPYLAPSHITALVDIACLFAQSGDVGATVVTTTANAPRVRPAVDAAAATGLRVQLLLLPFPSAESGLPDGCENSADLATLSDDLPKLLHGLHLLREPLRSLLIDISADCLVSDVVLTWTSDLAADIGIPRLVFHVSSPFVVAVEDQVELNGVLDGLTSDDEPFVVPGGLPHRIQLARNLLPEILSVYPYALPVFRDATNKSFGLVLNSFTELSPEYVELCKLGGSRRVWCVGPAFLRRDDDEESEIKSWLDRKEPESVLYVCFGSEHAIGDTDQLRELALALESSGSGFVWAVRGGRGGGDSMSEWLPEGFEERNEGKGVILRRWAPQRFILNHRAVGGFLTHCGWNSILEAVVAGVPMATWPANSDQFIGERFVADVLGIGARAVPEGVRWTSVAEERGLVGAEAIRRAVERVMGGGEMREKAKGFAAMARAAMEEGGSSRDSLGEMIRELRVAACPRKEKKKGEY